MRKKISCFLPFFLSIFTVTLEGAQPAGWKADPELVKSLAKRSRDIIYEESKVPKYALPDPLVAGDGLRVVDSETWFSKRRPEILRLFREHVYGFAPERPRDMKFRVFDVTTGALEGLAVRKQIRIFFTGDLNGPSMDLLLYLPSKAPRPVPVFLGLNFRGNHSITHDLGVLLSTRWMRSGGGVVNHRATEESRGSASSRWAVEMILKRGYGIATAYYGDIDPDFDDGFKNGVHGAFDTVYGGTRPPDAWGSIAAWAWGLSRAMDYLEQDADVDGRKVAVLGHSRLGKTALWAGAQDERFAIVISNDSGCGGAALSRRRYGESVRRINKAFPHWFCRNFRRYNDNENALPVDQHMLIALVAPRPVYVASADRDLWADPRGEFLSAKGADPVYKLLGTKGLPVSSMPPLNHPVHGTIGYHVRSGKHDVTDFDWKCYLDFADMHFGRKK